MSTAINVETSNATFTPNLSSISIFPNPSSDIFHIKMEAYSENINIELFSPIGQLLQTFNLGKNQDGYIQEQLDLTNYSVGVYWVKINYGKYTKVQKLVKK